MTRAGHAIDWTRDRASRLVAAGEKGVTEWIGQHGTVFVLLLVMQLVAYTYFYTAVTFTNHTLPNAWLHSYPSFKTWGEGRWLADLIIQAQGGSGVQSFQMIAATALQALNGILLAQILGLRRKRIVVLLAGLLCLYPAFLDYYSFSIDHVTFVLGDTFALLGARFFLRSRSDWSRVGGTSLLFLLAIAAYQPKVAIVGFLALAALLLLLSEAAGEAPGGSRPRFAALGAVGAMAVSVGIAVGLYWAATRLLVTADLGVRTHTNTLGEALREILDSYPKTLSYFTKGPTGLPPWLAPLPAVGIAIGVAALLRKTWQVDAVSFLASLAILVLVPIALRSSFVINTESWKDMGRILFAHGYCLAFFLGCGLRGGVLRGASIVASSACLYFFMVLATQQSNAAALKTTYEIGSLTRIAARAELTLGAPVDTPRPLVVAGQYPEFSRARYVRYPSSACDAHVFSQVFLGYRQAEILNFFLGRDTFRRPTEGELDRALDSTRGKAPWPAAGSVYLLDDILVVVLEPYRPGMPVTWTQD